MNSLHSSLIRKLLLEGMHPKDVAIATGAAKSTVSYHTRRLGLNFSRAKHPTVYDWEEVRLYLKDHGVKETIDHYGMSHGTWTKAKKRGDVPSKPRPQDPNTMFTTGRNRGSLKRAMVKLGTPNHCALCNTSSWMGKPLSMQLDHINGDKHDNRKSNLRLLCPNCHSQTPTYGGRNAKKQK